MTVRVEINQILKKAVQDGAFGLPIAFEDIQFDRDTKSAYIEITTLRGTTENAELGRDACRRIEDVMQLSVYFKEFGGPQQALSIVDAIEEYFCVSAEFAGTSERVTIRRTSVAPSVRGNGWSMIPVSIKYDSYTHGS